MCSEVQAGRALGVRIHIEQTAESKPAAMRFMDTFAPGRAHNFLDMADLCLRPWLVFQAQPAVQAERVGPRLLRP
eukprot:10718016-Alexandrium_andersonii.AAC.1